MKYYRVILVVLYLMWFNASLFSMAFTILGETIVIEVVQMFSSMSTTTDNG